MSEAIKEIAMEIERYSTERRRGTYRGLIEGVGGPSMEMKKNPRRRRIEETKHLHPTEISHDVVWIPIPTQCSYLECFEDVDRIQNEEPWIDAAHILGYGLWSSWWNWVVLKELSGEVKVKASVSDEYKERPTYTTLEQRKAPRRNTCSFLLWRYINIKWTEKIPWFLLRLFSLFYCSEWKEHSISKKNVQISNGFVR